MASLSVVPRSCTVEVVVTHANQSRRFVQFRFDLHDSVGDVKQELQHRTGTAAGSMQLQLFDAADKILSPCLDDSKPLGFYSIADGHRLHIIDTDPTSIASQGWLEDTSRVQKYQMPEAKYDQLEDNARKFKEKLFEMRPDLAPQEEFGHDYMEDEAAGIKVGERCEVDPGARRGEVKFVGRVKELLPGFWIGIQFDEPLGKHDGSIDGSRYFECPMGHGVFLRPDKVPTGDFPEKDPFDDEPDEI